MRFTGTIEAATTDSSKICESILRSLPQWFGIESAIQDYVRAVESIPMLVAKSNGRIVGFISIEFHNSFTAEIHVMAVIESYHRHGIGRTLVKSAEALARKQGAEIMMVKTLGPSRPDPSFDKTRNFYLSTGFRPLQELKTVWNEVNPCLIMAKPIAYASTGKLHHVEYYVNNLERARTFWSWLFGLMGWETKSSWDTGFSWKDPVTESYFVFAQVKPEYIQIENNRQGQGLNHIAISLVAKHLQSKLVGKLIEQGATIIYDDPGYICFEDPNQIVVELYVD